jgi:hypothetical protein
MLTAYIDESGHESRGWMFLAGFLGREDQWQEFVPKWKAALGKRKFLHMKDLRWKKQRTKQLLARLGPIPFECNLKPMVGGVQFKDYEDLVSGTPDAKLLKGYMACLSPMIIQTLRGIPEDERLELVFEEQKQYEPFVNIVLSLGGIPDHSWTRTKEGTPKLARWSFVPKGSTLRSDPADYLAYALRELHTDPTSKRTEWCEPLLDSNNRTAFGVILKRDKIRKLVIGTQMLNMFGLLDKRLTKLSGGKFH